MKKYFSPHRIEIFVPVFFGGHSHKAFKHLNEMALGRKRQIIGDIDQAGIRVTQKILGLFDFFLPDVIADGDAKILLEHAGKIAD